MKTFSFIRDYYFLNLISCGEGMWKMLQHSEPDDFVLATGKSHSVRKFCELTFQEVGIELEWEGEGENEKGIVKSVRSVEVLSSNVGKKESRTQNFELRTPNIELRTKNIELRTKNIEPRTTNLAPGTVIVAIDPKYYRPTEVDLLIGDASKAKEKLKWQSHTELEKLVKKMVKSDLFG